MISIATDDALQMLDAGWTVRHVESEDVIEWRSPGGLSGSEFRSESLDRPPFAAVRMAKSLGHVVHRERMASPAPRGE